MEQWRISGLRLSLAEAEQEQRQLLVKAAAALGLDAGQLGEACIYKKSLDAREAGEPFFVYTLDFCCKSKLSGHIKGRGLSLKRLHNQTELGREDKIQQISKLGSRQNQAMLVGAGPAGLFAALALAEAGYQPLLIEQGQPVEQRQHDVELFWRRGQLNEASNVQFGEGGAGTFSDGKLTFRGKDPLAYKVLQTLVEAGAPPQIMYWHKPHLGSDKLLEIMPRLRGRILAAGGQILFGTKLTGLSLSRRQGRLAVSGIKLAGAYRGELAVNKLILAPGNGARELFRLLDTCGVALAAKPFAVGLRIEHSQSLIDTAQYGSYAGQRALPVADYQLKYQSSSKRAYYSFCMCPGGYIVNGASQAGGLVTNGISLAARDSGRANSAIVGAVQPGMDFADEAMAALTWQEDLERAAFMAGGADFGLPVCMAEDFLRGAGASPPPPEFMPKSAAWRLVELRQLFPEELGEGLAQAIRHWDRQIKGFAAHGVLAAVESRTSCPLRILRGPDGQSLNVAGLYPAGEGAGYAGGIMSSAIDGLRAAAALCEQEPPRK